MVTIWCERTDCQYNDNHACIADMVEIDEDAECCTFESVFDREGEEEDEAGD